MLLNSNHCHVDPHTLLLLLRDKLGSTLLYQSLLSKRWIWHIFKCIDILFSSLLLWLRAAPLSPSVFFINLWGKTLLCLQFCLVGAPPSSLSFYRATCTSPRILNWACESTCFHLMSLQSLVVFSFCRYKLSSFLGE